MRKYYVATLVFLLALAFYTAFQKHAHSACVMPPFWYQFVSWPEGITAWALLFTLIAIAEQARDARKAAQAASMAAEAAYSQVAVLKRQIDIGISKERARIFVDMSPSELPCLNPGHRRQLTLVGGFDPFCMESDDFRMSVRHEGESSAYNVQSQCGISITSVSTGQELFRKAAARTSSVIRKGDPAVIEELSIFPCLSQALLDDINNESAELRFFGSVSYEDAFESIPRHESKFSYVWQIAREWIAYGDGEGDHVDQSSWRRHPYEDNRMR